MLLICGPECSIPRRITLIIHLLLSMPCFVQKKTKKKPNNPDTEEKIPKDFSWMVISWASNRAVPFSLSASTVWLNGILLCLNYRFCHPSRNTMSWCRWISAAFEDLSAMECCLIELNTVHCQIWIMHWHFTPTALYLSFCCVCTDRIDSHIIHCNIYNGERLETFSQWEKTWISMLSV